MARRGGGHWRAFTQPVAGCLGSAGRHAVMPAPALAKPGAAGYGRGRMLRRRRRHEPEEWAELSLTQMPASARPAVLFVCLGNICRSPIAEGLLRAHAAAAGVQVRVDSAGTGDWHLGRAPDPRAQAVAARHGVDISMLRARQVGPGDFREFTDILALDGTNLADLRQLRPAGATARLALLRDAVPGRAGQPIADPYYGTDADFDRAWAEIAEAVDCLIGCIRGRGNG